MKRTHLLLLSLIFCLNGFAQNRVILPLESRAKSQKSTSSINESTNQLSNKTQANNSKETQTNNSKEIESNMIGSTYFDLQFNYSMQNRIYKYDDGTIGGVWAMGFDYPSFMGDRGTGYNYYDGSDWGPFPTIRIESDRAGWPSYAPWGPNGELVVAHYSGAATDGLVISSRPNKGSGVWASANLLGPSANNYYLWPRATTGGNTNSDLHVIALTAPVANGGTVYQGMDGALLYSRSSDGGASWEIEDFLIGDINSNYYVGFDGDTYEIQTSGNNVAFLIGSNWTDLVLMKSTDNGDTWEKTIIWEHPYPMYDPEMPFQTDTFYCVDGSHSLAFDNTGKVHVAFGINRTYDDGTGSTYWFPGVGGIGFWNEDRPSFTNNMNALNPYGGPGSEMIEDYNLIGWTQDINGNGQLDILDDWGAYYIGFSSMPQLVIDNSDNIFLIYSSVTETYDNGAQNYRHLWARGFSSVYQLWGDFVDLNSDLIYIFSECVFPSCSPTSDDKIHLVYQEDNEPGLAVRGDEDPFAENYIKYMNIEKIDLIPDDGFGHLSGTVTKQNGGTPLGNATISLQGTSYSTNSNFNGIYTINNIPVGNYTAMCSKTGYVTEFAPVQILDNNTTTQNFQLEEPQGPPQEGTIGETRYDLQSNTSMQNRIYKYEDGTIGTIWMMGLDDPAFFDRGTGYNYYDGSEWEVMPTERLESTRTGWPSYMAFGESGEMVVSHDFGAGSLTLLNREEKGAGNWVENDFLGPEGQNIAWNRSITSGMDHNTIHLLALTLPVENGGIQYQGLNGALLYSRSSDGGVTWNQENIVLDGLTSSEYTGFTADIYEWASQDDKIAFLVGDSWRDLVLMKSLDNGNTWTKTVIWEHPYPLFDPNYPIATDTFYCVDGSHSLAIDNSGKIHVAFGINRAHNDGSGSFWFPAVDGVGYWNEDMPTFSNNLNALSPYGDPGSELIEDYNLIGWTQDINGNGQLDVLDDWGIYYLGFSSMPQLVIDEINNMFLVYSSVTELYDNGMQNYRHLWARGFNSATQVWGSFVDLNADITYIFSECVFPSCSPTSDDYIHLVFQEDTEPGMALKGDEDPFQDNFMHYINIEKADLIPVGGFGNLAGSVTYQNGGNPVNDASITLQGTPFSATSNYLGEYTLSNIPSGSYIAICTKNGYVTEYATVQIQDNNTTTQNFQLEEQQGPPVEGIIGETWYDLQSNSSMQNRIYKYDDGTIGSAWTYGLDFPNFSDRGTGYNYYDGTSWAPMPVERIESDRTGWPSYTPWGLNGEIVVAHYSGASDDGLIISSREIKGSGDWNFNEFFGPTSNNYYLWPRAISGGSDYNDLHVIAITAPVANGGSTYQGMDGALLYSRSPDGGLTWDHEHVLLDEINSNYYNGFDGDSYEIQTQGEKVAFLAGDAWTDLVLMKSMDNGDTWTKTVIWEHPYPLWSNTPTDTFYCVDGAHSLAFDQSGKIHVAFGINRAISEEGITQSWFPAVDGIGYWNENMPTFSNDLNALNPYSGAGSELIEDYNLIGWTQDINGNGELDVLDDWGTYYLGFSSMPQLVIDETNSIFLVYSSVTETYDNGIQNYRHLWARGSNDNGQNWGSFVHLTQDLIYIFSECVFPSLSPNSDNNIHLVFMEDNEPGMAVRGDEDPYGPNEIVYMNILKSDIVTPAPGGILDGFVTDAGSLLPIENATISLEGNTLSTTSGSDGYYVLLNIPPGVYTVNCSKMGYLNGSADVIIVENTTTTQNFELEEAPGLFPPENLTATVFGQNNVLLDWDEPGSGTVEGYNVYRDNNIIGFYLTTNAEDLGLQPGTYNYFVTAVYDIGESEASNVVVVTSFAPLEPPTNLAAFVNDNDVTLTWDPPTGGGSNSEWIQWDDGVNYGNGIGVTGGGTFLVASHWEPNDLINYNDMLITKISFFPQGDPDATFILMVWTGPNAGTQILSQAVTTFIVDEFNEITLSAPILIDSSTDLWFGYEVTHGMDMFPAGCDDGPAIPFKGDMISMDGFTWESMSTSYPALDYNWNLAAYVEELDGIMIKNNPIALHTINNIYSNRLSASPNSGPNSIKKVFFPNNAKDLLYYNIYRDEYLIGNTVATFYMDLNLLPGTYEYCVTSVYDEGESDCSETVTAFISEPCFPPENVTSTIYNITEVEVTWEPPSVGTVIGYNFYLNGVLLDFTTSTEVYFNNLGPGTFEFCVATVCEDGESEPECTDPITILLLPPTNFDVGIFEPLVVEMSWYPPQKKGLLGYNIYHKFNNPDFELWDFTPQNFYLYLAEELGLYSFFATALYDEGESQSTDTLSVLIDVIDENHTEGLIVYPNPACDYVTINSGFTMKSIKVFNHTGQIVGQKTINNKTVKYNTSQLSPGMYLFQIITNEGEVLKRIVIE